MSPEVILLVDRQGNIQNCNQGFLRLMGLSEKPVGDNLRDWIWVEKGQPDPLSDPFWRTCQDQTIDPDPNQSSLRLILLPRGSVLYTLSCYLLRVSDGFLIFGEKLMLADSQILNKMTVLNNELAELTRQLNRKNSELEKANEVITHLMNTDPLTQLANRRYFQEILSKSIAFASRHQSPLSLVMADLDHFKEVNDRFGHDVGDQVLVQFARLLQDHSRTEDLPSRFGGEEFIVILPGSEAHQAAVFAERIRREVERTEFPMVSFPITVSLGVASYLPGETAETLIKKADQALYQAKAAGRNRVVVDKSHFLEG